MHARIGAIGLLAVAAIMGPAVAAEAGGLHCGDTITTDVVLQQNLTCAGNALRVEVAEGQVVHVDLNGHRLKGNGTGTGIGGRTVAANGRTGDLVVGNGTIVGFASAFLDADSYDRVVQSLTLRNLRVLSNGRWLGARQKPKMLIENSSLVDSGRGGAGEESRASLTVRNSKFVRSFIRSSDESLTFLTGNTFVQGGFDGGVFSNVTATGNTFSDCGTGILMSYTFLGATTIDDNRFVRCGTGINLDAVTGTVSVQRNTFIENTGAGMVLARPESGLALTVADNTFRRNGGDGLTANGTQYGAGPAPSLTVTGNVAVGNGGHGLDVSNVVDGGGNVARANGTPPDCIGVVCTKH